VTKQLQPDDPVSRDDAEPVVDRVPVVEHQPDLAAGAQHAADFDEGRREIGHVGQHAPRPDDIERLAGERQPRDVALHRGSRRASEAEPAPHRRDAGPRQIERGDRRALPRELRGHRAEAAPDLEDAAPAQRGIVKQPAEQRRARRLREPGGAPELAIDAAEEGARGRVIRQVGPPQVPEIVHWVLVPPEANSAGDVVGGLRQDWIRRAIIESSSWWILPSASKTHLEPVWST